MVKKVTKFQADDGTEFELREHAIIHDAVNAKLAAVTAFAEGFESPREQTRVTNVVKSWLRFEHEWKDEQDPGSVTAGSKGDC